MAPLPATEFSVTTSATAALSAFWLVLTARRARAFARGREHAGLDAALRTLTGRAGFALIIVWLVETRIGSHQVTGVLAAAMVAATVLQSAASWRPRPMLDIVATWLMCLALLGATAILGWQALASAA